MDYLGQHSAPFIAGTVSSFYMTNTVEACLRLSGAEQELMSLLQGGQKALENPTQRFPAGTLIDLLHHAERASGIVGIGVLTGTRIRANAMADLGHAMVASDTLEAMIKMYRAYRRLLIELGEVDVQKHGDVAHVTLDFEGEPDANYLRPYVEKFFGGVATFGRWVTWDQDLAFSSIYFRHDEPDDLSAYESVFDCPVHFNAPRNMVIVPRGLVEHAMPQPNPELVGNLRKRLDQQMAEFDQPVTTARETFQVIRSIIATEIPTIIRVAEKMGTTERTLRRRLKEEGKTFRDVLEAARRDVCEMELMRGECSIAGLAQTLGYSEQSAFSRAFKSWYGMPPTQYLRKNT